MIQSDQREGAESPKYERVRQAGQGPLRDDFTLQHHFCEELKHAPSERLYGIVRCWAGAVDDADNLADTPHKQGD